MRKKRFLLLFFIFLAVAIIGAIGLALPADYETFSYSNTFSTQLTGWEYGFELEFNIKNKTNTDYSNAEVTVTYEVEHMLQDKTCSKTIIIDNIEKNDTVQVKFKHEETSHGIYSFDGFESITIKIDGKTYDVYKDSLLVGPNWYFFGMAFIGFIGGFVFFILWRCSNKKFIDPEFESNVKSISESIKTAFEPLTKATNEPKKIEKTTCQYCKCKYDGEKHDKCPNCGAPPEPKD